MGSKKKQTVGYLYRIDLLMCVCHGPVDRIRRILFKEKTGWEGDVRDTRSIPINRPDLFGGPDSEGGVSGDVDIIMGKSDEVRNPYLMTKLGTAVGAFRGIVTLVFKNFYIGTSYYLWDLWIDATRTQTGWDGNPIWYQEKCEILFPGQEDKPAMNAIHVMREIYQSTEWGMGIPDAAFDEPAWRAAADTAHAEGLGYSGTWQVTGSFEDKLKELSEFIDCVTYIDPKSGLHTVKMIRADFDEASLPVIDESIIMEVADYGRTTFADYHNCVQVKFWDQEYSTDDSVYVDNPALIASMGRVVPLVKENYSGLVDRNLALRIAQRDIRPVSSPFMRARLTCTRAAANLRPGDAFILKWSPLAIGSTICRVGTMKLGSHDNEAVELTVLEDVFSLPRNAAHVGESVDFERPSSADIPAPAAFATEAPYYEIAQRYGDSAAQTMLATNPDEGRAIVAMSKAGSAFYGDAFVNDAQLPDTLDISPSGALLADIDRFVTVANISWDRTPEVGTHVQIGDEIAVFKGLNSTGATLIGRGALDTTPTAHAANSPAWAWDAHGLLDETDRVKGETVSVKVRGRNPQQIGPQSAAVSVTMRSRAVRPYAPAAVTMQGAAITAGSAVAQGTSANVDFVVSWATRNRLLQTAVLLDYSSSSVAAEAGTTYKLTIRNASTQAVLHTYSSISEATVRVKWADLNLTAATLCQFDLVAVRAAYESWQPQRWTANLTPVVHP